MAYDKRGYEYDSMSDEKSTGFCSHKYKIRRAIKRHICYSCCAAIDKGETYHHMECFETKPITWEVKKLCWNCIYKQPSSSDLYFQDDDDIELPF